MREISSAGRFEIGCDLVLHLRSFNSSQQLHFDFQVLERTQTLGVEHVNSGDVTEM